MHTEALYSFSFFFKCLTIFSLAIFFYQLPILQ